MRRPVLLIAALVAAMAVGTATAAETPDDPAHLERIGWWWSLQTGLNGIELAPPVDVPEDGMLLQADLTGPSAIGAIRWILPSEATDVTLTLTAATPGTDAASSGILACPASGFWLPAHAGWWSLRAAPDCDAGQVAGELADDGISWSWQLDEVADGRVIDVVLTPDSVAPFRVVFQPPEPSAIVYTPEPAPDFGAAPTPSQPQPDHVPAPPLANAPAPTLVPPGPVPSTPPATAPQAPAVVAPELPPPAQPPVATTPAATTEPANPIAMILLGALLALGAVWLRTPTGPAHTGGLGRFTRLRSSTPSPLR